VIFVLEWPADAPAQAWFAYDERDLLAKVAANDRLPLWQIHDCISVRELLEVVDANPDSADLPQAQPGLWALGQEHGWDRPLYRADHLLPAGTYTAHPVSEGEAAAAALHARGVCRIYWTESEATAAFERADDAAWQGEGWRARWALRDQLVAMDVLADDL
jgi:hypothetical protein